ncbi:hypothetical protein pqer_cds_664 [Pandoravirus quercus]|uniref:Uncharacterized protein n=1 Tax=Pandoravirus quercus TaxID=2107709 RepID=A0A2U7U9H9_9VIRU|nr:hypothetical protein pqer_cds_664 [Pandoravirus quercus]AVK75086.1 hypothetical protein pqer_cds_664 [Pandoravirus quercus]
MRTKSTPSAIDCNISPDRAHALRTARGKNKKMNKTSASTASPSVSPRAVFIERYPWAAGHAPRERISKLAVIDFCLANQSTASQRTGPLAAVLSQQCPAIWSDAQTGRLADIVRKEVRVAYADAQESQLERIERETRIFAATGVYEAKEHTKREWSIPPNRGTPVMGAHGVRAIHEVSPSLSEAAADRLEINRMCARYRAWKDMPRGTRVAVRQYCKETRDERSQAARMPAGIL